MAAGDLLDRLKSGTPAERAAAAAELGRLKDHFAARALQEALGDHDLVVRDNAAYALAEMGAREAIPAILGLMKDPSYTVRKSAAKALGMLGAHEALPVLVEALHDPAYLVRKSAVRSLGQLGDPRAAAPLRALMEAEAGRPLEAQARKALALLGPTRASGV